MIVISDTSPILNLSLIGRLDLLVSLYEQVFIAPAVYGELTLRMLDRPSSIEHPARGLS